MVALAAHIADVTVTLARLAATVLARLAPAGVRRTGRVEAAGAKAAASTATAGAGTFVASTRHDGRFLLLAGGWKKGLGKFWHGSRAVGIMSMMGYTLDVFVFCFLLRPVIVMSGSSLNEGVSKKIFPARRRNFVTYIYLISEGHGPMEHGIPERTRDKLPSL
jgi:hypothetical protein